MAIAAELTVVCLVVCCRWGGARKAGGLLQGLDQFGLGNLERNNRKDVNTCPSI
jgi:hypothetical protein